jgi:hypothetical protein
MYKGRDQQQRLPPSSVEARPRARLSGLLLIAALAGTPFVAAAVLPSTSVPAAGTWLAWGGYTRFEFNPDALHLLGVEIERVDGARMRSVGAPGLRYDSVEFPALDTSALEVNHTGRAISGIGGGALRHAGGLVLDTRGGTLDLRGFSLRASADTRVGLDVVDAQGRVWFTADHAHYGFEGDAQDVFAMRHMNLRLSASFASLLGAPARAGMPVGGIDFHAQTSASIESATAPDGGVCNAPWPTPSAPAGISMIYGQTTWAGWSDSIYVKRTSADCTPTSTNCRLVVNADSSLRNSGTTAIAWYEKFNRNQPGAEGVPQPPYANDQHPYLIWNLYRLGSDGRIKQIGVSGVKHAFYTVNFTCNDPGCGPGHVIYPQCEDTYSNYNNDGSTYLGPRSEIIPHSAVWGRCGSIYDQNCDGVNDDGSGAQDLFQYRMNVTESELLPPLSAGARYFLEYWYIVRDDSAIYDAMASRQVAFTKADLGTQPPSANWDVALVRDVPEGADYHNGPVLSRWVGPVVPLVNAVNSELSTSLGRARIAVKASNAGGGLFRYEFAIANFDYAHAQIDAAHPNEPDLKLASNHGFVRLRVPLAAGTTVSGQRFDDVDTDAGNDWSVSTTAASVTWSAPAGANSLDWGTLYHFEFISNKPPADMDLDLVATATASEPEKAYVVPIRFGETIFIDGFEDAF